MAAPITNETTVASFAGDGATVAFSTTIQIQAADHVSVLVHDASYNATAKSQPTDYTVSGVGSAGGASVTFGVAPLSGETVYVYRNVAATQSSNFTPATINPDTLEQLVNKVTELGSQLKEITGRSMRLPVWGTGDMELAGDPVDWQDTVLGINASGKLIASTHLLAASIASVSAFAATLLDDTTAGAALTTLGLSAFFKTLVDDADADALMRTIMAEQSEVLHLEGASDQDETIRLASDATVKWDESEDHFDFDKQIYASKGIQHGVLTAATDYTILDSDPDVALVPAGASDRTYTLPDNATNAGRTKRFVKTDSGVGKFIISRAGTDTMGVNGVTSMELWFQDNWVDLMSDGAGRWIVVGTELFIIPVDSRLTTFLPNAGTATIWTDVDYSSRVPAGSAVIEVAILLGATTGECIGNFRKNGDTDESDPQVRVATTRDDGGSSREFSYARVEVDSSRIYEYKLTGGAATKNLWGMERGYQLG